MQKLKKWWSKWIVKEPWDHQFVLLSLMLLALGLLMLFSASFPSAYYETGDSYYYVKRQVFFVAVGLVLMWAVSHVDYHYLYKISRLLMFLSLFLLGLVLTPKFGKIINGARRWFNFFDLVAFQPSELAKLALIVEFSASVSKKPLQLMKTFRYGIVPYLIWFAAFTVLMMAEPHLSGTFILIGTGAMILYVGGISYLYVGLGVGGIAAVIWGLLTGWIPYGQDRIAMWQDPFVDATGEGYQLAQSLITIGSGGLFGVGLGQSRQKFLYLPEESNDFIFAVICEEVGLVGATLILLAFAMLIIRGYRIARCAPDRFGALLVTGVISQVAIQTFFNVAVVTGLFPTTGISLPFFSYGGSAMLALLTEMGIVLSVTRQIGTKKGERK